MHPSSRCREAEDILRDCVHDIRQPLSNIESGVVVLTHLLGDSSGPTREYLRMIERQVELAARTLDQAAAELRRLEIEAGTGASACAS